jgi:hypothetical protein
MRHPMLIAVVGIALAQNPMAAQVDSARSLPFAIGERLTYRVSVGRLGTIGRGTLTVEAAPQLRGTEVYLLRFDMRARKGPLSASNRMESWVDPIRMASLRFHKKERQPLSKADHTVDLFPEHQTWEAASGERGVSPSDAPLDELSFIYFLRTLELAPDSVYRFNRHFEAARNPTTVHVLGRETVTTAAGTFATIAIEMRVEDARRYQGSRGVIRINLTDDAHRMPVRIESAIPVIGAAVFTLEACGGALERKLAEP